MLFIPRTDDYLGRLTDEEVKDFVATNFREYFKAIRKGKYLRKSAKSIYIFLTAPDKVEKYVQSNSYDNCIHQNNIDILNIFDTELQQINIKPLIKKIKRFFK